MRNYALAALAALCIALPARATGDGKTVVSIYSPVAGQTATSTVTATTTCGTSAMLVFVGGFGGAAVDVRGTFVATLRAQTSVDGINFSADQVLYPDGGGSETTSITAPGSWTFPLLSRAWLCIYGQAYTSGTATVNVNASSSSPYSNSLVQQSASGISGTLTTITTDTVALTISGSQWATVKFTVNTAGTATATSQISVDGGTNWIASAYAKRLSTVNANPTVQAISATTLVTGDTWEVPLPGNATHFRLLCGGTGTVTTVTLSPQQPYISGAPVLAVLYDQTSGTNAILDTGIIDTSGWSVLGFAYTAGAAGSMAPKWVDDTGATPVSLTSAITGTAAVGTFGDGSSASNSVSFLPKRVEFVSQAIVGQTSRIRVEVRR